MTETAVHELAEGFACYAPNRQEARMIYTEMFTGRDYLPAGTRLPDGAFVVDAGGNIGLVKVDAEGAELDVLRGIDDADWARIDRLAMEVQDHDGRLARIVDLLRDKGYGTTVELPPLVPPAMRTYLVYAERR